MSIQDQFCPECSRGIYFESPALNYKICPSCGTPVFRDEKGSLSVKQQFPISDKNDLLQVGTKGRWQGREFTLTGRFRCWFDESVFNYWTMLYTDGSFEWLGEGYGIYSVLTEDPTATWLHPRKAASLKMGKLMDTDEDHDFVLLRRYDTLRFEVEGAIWWPRVGETPDLLELSGKSGGHIHALLFGDRHVYTFKAVFARYGDFGFSQLNQPAAVTRELNCRHCKTVISLRAFPYSQSCGCPQCGAIYQLKDGMDFDINRKKSEDHIPVFNLGTTGTIDGIEYEVIGFVVKEDQSPYLSQWREYTLYNRQEGFTFLSEYDGHWIFLREERESPLPSADETTTLYFRNEPFLLFNSYTFRIVSAKGEFPANIFDNQQNTRCREFISPPEIWSQEKSNKEGENWFHGRHISRAELKTAFGPMNLPYQVGIGSVQPTGFLSLNKTAIAGIVGILLLMMVHAFIGMGKSSRPIITKRSTFTDSTDQVQYVVSAFTLDKWRSNLQLDITAPVKNQWFELNATLVNTGTGKEYTIEKGVEFYTGYSEGEQWSEGSTEATAYFSGIPAGNYLLQVHGRREIPLLVYERLDGFTLDVKYDVPMDRNAGIAISVFLVFLVSKYLLMQYREKQRWSNSPYSP